MQTGLPSYGNRAYVSAHPLVEISGGSRGASHDSFGVKREESWESFRSTEACRKDPTMATSMKTSLKNRLGILSLFFAIIPRGPVT